MAHSNGRVHGGFIHKGCIYEGVHVGKGEEKGKETIDFLQGREQGGPGWKGV